MADTVRNHHPISPIVLVAIVLTIGALTYGYFNRPDTPTPKTDSAIVPDPPSPDPRLTYETPFRNIKPGVKYVGDAACASCHPTVCKSFHDHPMGRSADFVKTGTPLEKYPPNGKATFASGPFDFAVEKTNEAVRHRVRLRDPASDALEALLTADVAIGSGTRGRSYLNIEQGFVWQTPVSWFGPDEKWDISPGFRIGRTLRRPIAAECLYCHTDSVEPVPDSTNRFREPLFAKQAAIGCERCHGPGELHVSERTNSLQHPVPDTTIVNPRHLSPTLQRAVCEQCHLQGQERVNRRGRDLFEFRPGLPFELFVSVYVRHPDIAHANKSVGQFEQMEQSKCFIKGGGAMTCTSCHDPHASPVPAERSAAYRSKCLSCHQEPSKVCSATLPIRQAQSDSCVACHMPKAASSNITHASVTNHRIPRTPSSPSTNRPLPFGTVPLVRFRAGDQLPPEEIERDLGIALSRFAKLVPPQEAALRGDPRTAAITRLKTSLARWPGDVEAWESLAEAWGERGDMGEKLKAAKNAFQLAPESESAVAALTAAATVADEIDLALSMADKWVSLTPKSSDPLVARAFIHLKRSDWARSEADCRAALKINPLHAESHLYLAICLHRQGNPDGGAKESQIAVALEQDPRERAYLQDWYRRATR